MRIVIIITAALLLGCETKAPAKRTAELDMSMLGVFEVMGWMRYGGTIEMYRGGQGFTLRGVRFVWSPPEADRTFSRFYSEQQIKDLQRHTNHEVRQWASNTYQALCLWSELNRGIK